MFNWFRNQIIKREAKKNSVLKKQFAEWNKVQSAIILVNEKVSPALSDFIKSWAKDVYIIIFHNDSVSKSAGCYLSLNKKDLNILGMPNKQTVAKIKSRSYDLLINTDFENRECMKALSGIIAAKCKLGSGTVDYNRMFDISIQSTEDNFLEDVKKYLMMIKT